jgi:pimeloyl-ACP methyl ester carboxylesterase
MVILLVLLVLALVVLALVPLVWLGLVATAAWLLLAPNPLRAWLTGPSPGRFGLRPQPLRLPGGCAALLYPHPSASRAVVVCHGRSRSQRWMLPLVARLARDAHVVSFDFPGHGDSPAGVCTIGLAEAAVVNEALDLVETLGYRDVVVYGVSMGGVAAVHALAARPRVVVRGLITDGSFDTLRRVLDRVAPRWSPLRPLIRAAIARIRRQRGLDLEAIRPVDAAPALALPWLVLHGDRDPLVPPAAADALAGANPTARVVRYRGGHDQPHNLNMQLHVADFVNRA